MEKSNIELIDIKEKKQKTKLTKKEKIKKYHQRDDHETKIKRIILSVYCGVSIIFLLTTIIIYIIRFLKYYPR